MSDASIMNTWLNTVLPSIVSDLEASILKGFQVQIEEGLNLSGRNEIYVILDDLLAVLFPGVYSRQRVTRQELNFFLGDMLRHVTVQCKKLIQEVFEYHCLKKNGKPCDKCDCVERSQRVCTTFIEGLTHVRSMLLEDIEAAFEGDPAAQSKDEIVLSYPGIEAIAVYRIAHLLYELEVPIIPRIMSEHAHSKTGIDIHPGAAIQPHFFIDHGTGVVIGETCIIGRNVKLYQGVTLGAISPFDKSGHPRRGEKRHPDIEDDVIIYANATILGGKTVIGKGSIIGGNTWITRSVPPGSVIYSNTKEDIR
ncbi:MAG: hypothetical protein JW795_21690 [Chitinivibrionales bacterium]|nr:hypothetical protein [Chitinivibrionales bacterium]